MMSKNTRLRRVKMNFSTKDQKESEDKEFDDEVKFYTKMKSSEVSKKKDYAKRLESCDPSQMFEKMLKLVDETEDN